MPSSLLFAPLTYCALDEAGLFASEVLEALTRREHSRCTHPQMSVHCIYTMNLVNCSQDIADLILSRAHGIEVRNVLERMAQKRNLVGIICTFKTSAWRCRKTTKAWTEFC